MLAIQVENLHFRYPHSQRAIFSGLDWAVPTGDFWVIIGANGSGKTSLVRLLLGLEYANKGSICIFGQSLGRATLALGRLGRSARVPIGYVPQQLYFDRRLPIPVLDVVEGGALPSSFWGGRSFKRGLRQGQGHAASRQRAELCLQSLARVGMATCANDNFASLSGGQRQRVLIARALATQSPILILDEPTASVDPTAGREIVQICQQLRKKHTILFISHDISMIPDVCEYILCLSAAAPAQQPNNPLAQGAVAHSHDVRGLSRQEILLLLYSHWGLNQP